MEKKTFKFDINISTEVVAEEVNSIDEAKKEMEKYMVDLIEDISSISGLKYNVDWTLSDDLMSDITRNLIRNKIGSKASESYEVTSQYIYNGFKGINNLTDEELIDEIKIMGYPSLEVFEKEHYKDLGLQMEVE